MTEDQKESLTHFLDRLDRDEQIKTWLIDIGFGSRKAQLMSGVLLPYLLKFLEEERNIQMGFGSRKVKMASRFLLPYLARFLEKETRQTQWWLDSALKEAFEFYDTFMTWLGGKILQQILARRPARKKSPAFREIPRGFDPGQWKEIEKQCRNWVEQLERLDLLAWSLGDLETEIDLPLDGPRLEEERPPSRLLAPGNTLIPFLGRIRELEILDGWRQESTLFSWRVIAGEGGVGKTRLAQEFAFDSQEQNWHCGFLHSRSLDHLISHYGFLSWKPLTDTLIIVDSAAYKLDSLKNFLYRCALWSKETERLANPPHLRLLLLDRHANSGSGWLKSLRGAWDGYCRDFIQDSMKSVVELMAPGRTTPEKTMVRILETTFKNWGNLHQTAPPPLPDFDEMQLRQLRINTQGRPYFLQMAALQACEAGNPEELVRRDRASLLREAVRLERQYIQNRCPVKEAVPFVERAAALLFIVGARPPQDPAAVEFLKQEAVARGCPETEIPILIETLVRVFGEQTIQGQPLLQPFAQDSLGAAFSISILEENPDLMKPSLKRAIDLGGLAAWANLMRAAQDLYQTPGFNIQAWLPPLLFGRPIEELLSIELRLPKQVPALASFGVTLIEALKFFAENEQDLARLLNNLAEKYADLEQYAEAVDNTRQAVNIYQSLAPAQPEKIEPLLAASLNQLGYLLGLQEEYEDALICSRKAAKIYRRLDQAKCEEVEPELADTLHNLGRFYSKLGNHVKAPPPMQRAVDIYERLTRSQPDVYEPGLAKSLINLSRFTANQGNRKKALATAKRAVEIFERLTEFQPDAFEPDLADSLDNLGTLYRGFDNKTRAREAARRSVEIHDRLNRAEPGVFEPGLANSLNHLGLAHRKLGNLKEALQAAEGSVFLYERLAGGRPKQFEPGLAESLNHLGNDQLDLGNPPKALASLTRSVEIYRRLAESQPRDFERGLARSLGDLARVQHRLGKVEEALLTDQRAMAIHKRLALAGSEATDWELAQFLDCLGNRYQALEKHEEALGIQLQVVKLYERLARLHPESFMPDLARVLTTLGKRYLAADRREEAVNTGLRVIDLYERLARVQPNLYQAPLAVSLGALGSLHMENNDPYKAHPLFERGVQTLRRLFFMLPRAYADLMSDLMGFYLAACQALGQEPGGRLIDPILGKLNPPVSEPPALGAPVMQP